MLATKGAFSNITSLLPPSLQTYIDTTLDHVNDALSGSNHLLEAQGLPPTVIYSSLACAALAIPLGMYGYSGGWGGRGGVSPYSSQVDSQGFPHVTEDDFSYITSQDIESESIRSPRGAPRRSAEEEDDDVLNVKSKGKTLPIQFPAYSIGDGKLYVRDVRERVCLMLNLDTRQARQVKMLYKGRQLKEQDIPIRDYGVKNNSELLLVVPDQNMDDESSSDDIVVTESLDGQKPRKKKNNNKSRNKKKKNQDTPYDGGANLDVPGIGDRGRPSSAESSRHPSRIPSPAAAVPAGPSETLDAIRSHFDTNLLPMCRAFATNPPRDPKKLEEEHRKLSETAMQHTILKLDEVDTGGDPEIRKKRKALVNYVQDVLKEIDQHMPGGGPSR